MYREAPAPRGPITISYRVYSGGKVFLFGALVLVVLGGSLAGVLTSNGPPLAPLALISLCMSPFVFSIANDVRPITVTIDHARGVVSFKPSFFSTRNEIEIARVLDVEIETAIRVVRGNRGPSEPPTPVGRICLVLEDDKVPIEKRMREEMAAHRDALAKIKEALAVARPDADSPMMKR